MSQDLEREAYEKVLDQIDAAFDQEGIQLPPSFWTLMLGDAVLVDYSDEVAGSSENNWHQGITIRLRWPTSHSK